MELKHYQRDNDKQHPIIGIEPDSIAMELGIVVGDRLVSINGKVVNDALDYHLFIKEEIIDLVIYKIEHDEAWLYEIEKDEEEDLGLIFDNNLMDKYQSCRNKCVFCFIDQLPKGMRDTLYFKDDDARLSFLQGNYITLTNMTEREVSRIIEYHLSPINISVHTMNLELRKTMLKNKHSGKIAAYMDRLYEAGITMNGQIVLCKGLNDKEELAYSIEKLSEYLPHMQSMSVVPVGLSKHREGLYPLEPFTKEDCIEVVELIESWQDKLFDSHGTHFVHASDEFYIMADKPLPEAERYDGYLQLENGVGMSRVLIDEFMDGLSKLNQTSIEPYTVTVVTGKLFEPLLQPLVEQLMAKIEGLQVNVVGIVNEFFGEMITVSGLLVGQDIIKQLVSVDLGDKVLLPDNLLKNDEDILLDDVTLKKLKEEIEAPVVLCDQLGTDLIEHILRDTLPKEISNE